MAIDLIEIGKRIREIRGQRTGTEFGELIGVSNNMISIYESGGSWPKPQTLDKIIELSGKPAEWLLYGIERDVQYQTPPPGGGSCGENEKGEAWIGLAPTEQDIMNEIRNLPVEEVEDLKAYLRLKRRTGLKLTLSLAEHGHQTHPNKQSGG